ncbi:putative cytochrome P450 [Lupinus albus]|uniref:Putative cytochrome P450 n=1 Tax=Lupinus albus TaxID=3870 RepID=A0A6A4MTU5_LUPAL|nr:putative cytochrome P450 [Lupinus albus]
MEFKNLLSQSTLPFIVLGVLLLLFVLTSIRSKNRSSASRKAPPEARGAWPLIGHLHLLVGSLSPHVILSNMADKYGPVFSMRLGVQQTLIVSNSDMAKECFTINDRAFASRPKSIAFEILGYNFSMLGFSPYGSYWRQVRKIATLELLSNHRIESLKHVIEWEVVAAMKESYSLSDSGKVVVTEMKKWFGDITHNIMFRMIVGKRFDEGK